MWLWLSMTLAAVGLVALSGPALAGGFAVTTLDQLPTTLRANESFPLGYTIRQHGVTPLPNVATRIVAQHPATGESIGFVGRPAGEPGHYVAEVRFPAEGVWLWQVEQGPFAPQQLGSVSVVGAPGDARADDRATLAGRLLAVPAVRSMLPLATVVALVLFAWRLVVLLLTARSTHPEMRRRAASGARLAS